MKNFLKNGLVVCALGIGLSGASHSVLAQKWVPLKSDTTLFELRMLDNYTDQYSSIPVGPGEKAISGQTVATIQSDSENDTVRNYIIKVDHTLGPPPSDDDISDLIFNELSLYENHYRTLGGTITEKTELMYHSGIPGGELYIDYTDPTLGAQSLRARILFTDTARVQQIVAGPPSILNSFPTRDYYSSLSLRNGYSITTGEATDSLASITSPKNTVTAYYPKAPSAFLTKEPQAKENEKAEKMRIQFYDPLWRQSIFHNIYTYILDGDVNFLTAENIMNQQHVLRHRFAEGKVEIQKDTESEVPALNTIYNIASPDKYPYIDTVKLRAFFKGNTVVVHEIMASERLADSAFINRMIDLSEFHPEKAQ